MNKNNVVELKQVSKKIGNKKIIDDLSFAINPGEVFGFLGPNGAGKTTTIKMMVGLMEMTKGDVWIKGINIKENFEEAISHVGGIVENPEMYKFMSGYKNLVHYARMSDGVTKERIEEVIKLVGLEQRIHDKVKTYSLGMRQRLGIAQALLHSPSLLILDEPTNGLDPAGIREIRDYIRKLAKEEGIAVLISSHILSEIELICDRIGIIQNGRLIDVQQVKGNENEQPDKNKQSVNFIVDSVKHAKQYIREEIIDNHLPAAEQELNLFLSKEEIPDMAAQLINHGVKIYGIKANVQTLEDKFLELTGGNGNGQIN